MQICQNQYETREQCGIGRALMTIRALTRLSMTQCLDGALFIQMAGLIPNPLGSLAKEMEPPAHSSPQTRLRANATIMG